MLSVTKAGGGGAGGGDFLHRQPLCARDHLGVVSVARFTRRTRLSIINYRKFNNELPVGI